MVGYEINEDKVMKVITVVVNDKMTLEQAGKFTRDYKRLTKTIDSKLFVLDIDCTAMKVVTPDLIDNLGETFKMYNEPGFKKVIMKVRHNNILKMQLTRLSREARLTNVEILNV
ncbi:hypothetical protein ACQKMD_10520 [Viridibacillus sp. NPDC096237]|uniref:hypothetical protein n=1 Tax=Viridibacillus sp. NPDC096237 TaxID=3390721 RepID=UPI003D081DD9